MERLFFRRLNEKRCRSDALVELLFIGIPISAWRWREYLTPSAVAVWAAYGLLLLLGMAARNLRPELYRDRREWLAAALRLLPFAFSGSQAFSRAFASDTSAWEASGGWVRAGLLFPLALIYCSQGGTLALVGAGRPIRLPFQLALQALAAALASRANADMCASPLLRHPAAQALTQRAYAVLGWSTLLLPLGGGAAGLAHASSPASRCCCLLGASQLLVGLAFPVALVAVSESRGYDRAFAVAQRGPGMDAGRRAALRKEVLSSWQGRAYAAVLRLERRAAELGRPALAICVWLSLGVVWQVLVASVHLGLQANGGISSDTAR